MLGRPSDKWTKMDGYCKGCILEVVFIITNNKTQSNISFNVGIDKVNDITSYKWKIIALSKLFNYI